MVRCSIKTNVQCRHEKGLKVGNDPGSFAEVSSLPSLSSHNEIFMHFNLWILGQPLYLVISFNCAF